MKIFVAELFVLMLAVFLAITPVSAAHHEKSAEAVSEAVLPPSHGEMKALAVELFAAWSSGDADAPAAFVSDDSNLIDTAADQNLKSWEEARGFFASAIESFPDLKFELLDMWYTRDPELMAVRWVMTGTHNRSGRTFVAPGMSTLRIRGGKVIQEIDYYAGWPVNATRKGLQDESTARQGSD